MDLHQNARLTPVCRELMVRRVLAVRAKAQVGRELGVSVKTVDKWYKRYAERGLEGLQDRSSRLHRFPGATEEVLKAAVTARRRQRFSLVDIAGQLGAVALNGCAHRRLPRSCLREPRW
jgi:transposase